MKIAHKKITILCLDKVTVFLLCSAVINIYVNISFAFFIEMYI